jgi:hypothetical protein
LPKHPLACSHYASARSNHEHTCQGLKLLDYFDAAVRSRKVVFAAQSGGFPERRGYCSFRSSNALCASSDLFPDFAQADRRTDNTVVGINRCSLLYCLPRSE